MPWSADRAEAPHGVLLADDVLSQITTGELDIIRSLGIVPETLAQFAMECIWAVIQDKLQAEQLPLAIQATGLHEVASPTLCHVFWLVWSDIEGPNMDAFCEESTTEACDASLDTEQAVKVVEALKECRKHSLILEADMMEVLDLRLLVQSGSSAPHAHRNSFAKKILVARNAKSLKIPIFNIFREELEGYAKLITLLNNPAVADAEHTERLRMEIDQLAGYYRLSPGKVASCIIVAMEKDLSLTGVLMDLPYLLPRWCLDHIKFALHGNRLSDGSCGLSQEFFDTIAILLKHERLVLEEVCYEMDADFEKLPDKARMKELVNNAVAETTPSSTNVLSAGSLNLDLTVADCTLTELMPVPQWPALQFILALARHGSWRHVRALLRHMKFKALVHRTVCLAIADRLETALSDQTVALFPSGPLGPCILPPLSADQPQSLPIAAPFAHDSLAMIQELGPLLFRRPGLLVSLWRILHHIILTHESRSLAHEDALFVIRECALPASCFLASHTQVWLLAEQTLFKLPQLLRCQLYHHTATRMRMQPLAKMEASHAMNEDAVLELLKVHASRINSHLGSLCKKLPIPRTAEGIEKDLRPACLLIGKVVTAHPIAAAQRMVELCRMYDTSTEVFVTFAGTLLPILRELLVYEVVRNLLVSVRDRSGPQQAGPAEWLANLATFIGKFVTRYQDIDCYVVFAHVAQNLRQKKYPLEVLIAGSIFDHSFGSLPEQVNLEQRLSLFYGPIMRSHKLKNDFFSAQTLAVQCERLLRSLHGGNAKAVCLIVPLYIMLCQQRSNACTSADTKNVRTSFEATQRTHHVVLQYIELMRTLPVAELAQLLPKLSVLIHNFQIGAECAMSVYRPLLRILCGLDADSAPARAAMAVSEGDADSLIPLLLKDSEPVLGVFTDSSDSRGHGWASGVTEAAPEAEEEGASNPQENTKKGLALSPKAFFQDLCSSVPILAETATYQFSPQFYVMFWALELPDLAENVKDTYKHFEGVLKAELEEQNKRVRELQSAEQRSRNRQWATRSGAPEEPLVTKAEIFEATESARSVQRKINKVPDERDKLFQRSEVASAVFERHAHTFCPSSSSQRSLCNSFMQECIVPRCIFSVEDAIFCAQILYRMALIDPPHFQFAYVQQAVFNEVSVLLRSCTQQETTNLSFFFKQMFVLIEKLTKDGQLPKIDSNKDSDGNKWTSLKRKHQRQMCGVLITVLNAHDSGEVIQKNALNMINELMPHLVTDRELQSSLLASFSKLQEELQNSSGDSISSVQMLLTSVIRQVTNMLPNSGARDDRHDAEEGEVVVDVELVSDLEEGLGGKRLRENGNDDVRSARPRVVHDHVPRHASRQFGGERGGQHR